MEFLSVIYLIIGILSSAAMTVVLKIFRQQTGNRYGIILGNYLTCVVIAFLMMPDKSGILHPDTVTILCGIIGGILFVTALITMQSSIHINGAILTSAFSKMGLVVPLLISAVFLGDSIRILQIPGILCILFSFWLINTDRKSFRSASSDALRVQPVLLLAVLLVYGAADAMARIFDHVGRVSDNQLYFLILFATAAVLTLILAVYESRKTGRKIIRKEFLAGILVGIPNYFSSALLLLALNGLPSFVVYPCFSAGTLLLVTILGAAVFKEKPGRKAWIGLALIVPAMVILNL